MPTKPASENFPGSASKQSFLGWPGNEWCSMFLPFDDGKTQFFDPFGDHNIMDNIIYYNIATHWNLECDFGNGALQKKRRKMPKSGVLHFFAPFFQSRHLSNGDLRMRAHRIVYHIIVSLSWFWVGIVRSPRSSNVNLECRHLSCDFHQQRMLFFKFYRHFGHILRFFLGVGSSSGFIDLLKYDHI